MLFAAALAIASVACTREEILDGGKTRGELRTFTCSFDEDAQTRTDITKQGKTVWSEGDRIFVTNGAESDTLTVDAKFAGQRYFENATCTLAGSHKHTRTKTDYPIYACSLCEYQYEDKTAESVETETKTEVIEPLGHEHTKDITKQVTCEEDGLITYTCIRGDDTYTETVTKLGHKWSEGTTTKEPTCTLVGIRTITCSNCQKVKTEEIPALKHQWNEGEVTTLADCITEGVMTYTCLRCNDTKDEKFGIDKDNHNYQSKITIEPKCTVDGEETFTCSRCSNSYTKPVKQLGHDWDSGEITTEPKCEQTGIKTFKCNRCDETQTQTVDALGHDWNSGEVTTVANCTTDGIKTYTCNTCGEKKTENIGKDLTNHDYIREVTVEPTCTKEGEEKFTCSRCGDSYTNVLPMKDHTQTGIKTFKCNRCDETQTQTVDALGHDWNSGEVTTVANCTTDGIKTYTCNTCGEKKTENIGKGFTGFFKRIILKKVKQENYENCTKITFKN